MGRVYGGQSAQERTDTRRRQFLDAGLEVMGTRGWANTTVRGVCDEAGLSTRFFYEGFDSLEDLAVALYEETVSATFATVVTAMTEAGADRSAQAHAGAEAMVAALTDDPRRARVVLVHAFDNPAIGPRRRETMRRLADIIAAFGRAGYRATDAAEPLLRITATMVAGGVAELILAWVDGELDVTRDQLIDSCARLVIGIGDTAVAMSRGD